MGIYRGPCNNKGMKRNGLILLLDPSNTGCVRKGDTTCKNLITGGLVTGASGSPGAGDHTPNPSNFPSISDSHSGIFDFTGGKGMNCEEDLGAHSAFSLFTWIYKTSSGSEYITDARNNGGVWNFANYGSNNLNYNNNITHNFGGTYSNTNPDFLNHWFLVTFTSDSNGGNLYLNGVPAVGGNRNSTAETLGKNFRIGCRYTTQNQWTGYMGPVYAYNRVLSAEEVLSNFNSQRDRFGI